MSEMTRLSDVLDYTPVPSRFGTSGVRALVQDLTDLEIYSLSLGTLRYMEQAGELRVGEGGDAPVTIPVADDLRPSSERILRATVRAVMDAGYDVDYLGRIPTPALTLYGLEHGVASLMVTGSHIPTDRNGQKANRCDGEVMKSDEQGITQAVEAARQQEYQRPVEESMFNVNGMLKSRYRPVLPLLNADAERLYVDRYRQAFPAGGLKGRRLVFFEYAAVGRDLLPAILEGLGAEVIRAGRSDEFVPIDTEAISDAHLAMLSNIVAEARREHGPIDALLSTDGDSDRPLIIGVDEAQDGSLSLRFFPGDLVGIVVADYLQADAVAVPISVNPAVHEHFQGKDIVTTKTRIGSPFVISAMQEALAKGRKRVVGWEANGGFLVGSEISVNDGVLRPLPSRDAVLPILCVLYAAAEQGGSLSALFDRLPRWYGKAGLIDDFPRATSQRIMAYFAPPDENVKWMDFGADRIVLRDLNEAVIAEWDIDGPEAREALAKRNELQGIFTGGRGFSGIVRINTQDGVRCFFANEDIAHIRPSGNAPQLRIYACARDQERANEIVSMGLEEPNGILRELQRLIEGKAA